MMTNLHYETLPTEKSTKVFESCIWPEIIANIKKNLLLTNKESAALFNQGIPKLISYSAFRSGIKNADLIAAGRVSLFVQVTRNKSFFSHRLNQSIIERVRLLFIHTEYAKNRQIEELSILLCTYISACDHLNDYETDKKNNWPNPILTGTVDIDDLKANIEQQILKYDTDVLKELEYFAPRTLNFWNGP
jgi:hypothetical protein